MPAPGGVSAGESGPGAGAVGASAGGSLGIGGEPGVGASAFDGALEGAGAWLGVGGGADVGGVVIGETDGVGDIVGDTVGLFEGGVDGEGDVPSIPCGMITPLTCKTDRFEGCETTGLTKFDPSFEPGIADPNAIVSVLSLVTFTNPCRSLAKPVVWNSVVTTAELLARFWSFGTSK